MVVDIVDHFSKFMWSYTITKNNAKNIFIILKQFIFSFGTPEILQSDNEGEYKNELISNFWVENKIKQIFSSPYRPSTNGELEVTHKEIRRHIMLDFLDDEDNFDLNNSILDPINIHNNNIYTSTGYKTIELLSNTSDEIFNELIKI